MATRTTSAPAGKTASSISSDASTKAMSSSGKAGVQASKAAPKSKRRVWDYIKSNGLQDKVKRST